MVILCTIDLETREVSLPAGQVIASYDHNVDVIRFQAETIPGFSLDTSSIRIAAQGPNKARHDYAVDPSTVAIEEETGYITFDWPIPAGVTEMPIGSGFKYGDRGQLIFAVCAEIISGSTVSKAWHSDDGIITVVAHLEPESGGGEDPEEEATNAQKIAQLQTDVAVMGTQVGALANGSPTPVATVAEMTDESAVYLYTGSETGYTAGNWYFWNGTTWTSGGTYGGAVTSTTFNQHGVPADDFAVGQALADKADADDVDARFDTVEQAIEDVTFDGMDMLVTEVSDTVYGGNLMDMSNATRNASGIISGGRLYHPSSGMFYSNPWGNPGIIMRGHPKDADGNAVEMTINGETATELILYNGTNYVDTLEFADSTHITKKTYVNTGSYDIGRVAKNEEIVLAEAPAYWYCEGKGPNLEHGITAEISTTYVPYAEPVVTHSYEYADALDEHIEEIAGSSGGGGGSVDNGDAFEASYNLLDNSKIVWREGASYDVLEDGYYMPITAGDKVVCNGGKTAYHWYDSTKTHISNAWAVNPYQIVTAPNSAEWLRVEWVGGVNEDGTPMVVYKVASTATTWDDQRPYVPTQKIKGDYVEGDIYDHAFPTSLDSDILLASQFNAVKAFNKTRNGIRIGTFNIFYPRQRYGWETIKRELKDYSLEICAFEEVVNTADRVLQTFLSTNTWQYAYGSNPLFSDVLIDKALVSHYEVVSSEAIYTTVGRCSISGKPCLRTVINLPMYKRNAHQFTLAVYALHLDLNASDRQAEAAEIAAIAAADTADFVIAIGDTNCFKTEADARGKRPTWEAFVTQGFTPIHYGEYSTVEDMTDTDTSIDQIFMGANITCAGYDIVPSSEYTCMVGDTEQPVSDHCMVYADLIFDYDAVLSALQGV